MRYAIASFARGERIAAAVGEGTAQPPNADQRSGRVIASVMPRVPSLDGPRPMDDRARRDVARRLRRNKRLINQPPVIASH